MIDPILKSRADAQFKIREEQKTDAVLAGAEYRAAGEAVRAKTARLRAERLAREAEGQKQSSRGKLNARKK